MSMPTFSTILLLYTLLLAATLLRTTATLERAKSEEQISKVLAQSRATEIALELRAWRTKDTSKVEHKIAQKRAFQQDEETQAEKVNFVSEILSARNSATAHNNSRESEFVTSAKTSIRHKREKSLTQTLDDHVLSLPAVPLPAPPPFSANFAISPFSSSSSSGNSAAKPAFSHFPNAFAFAGGLAASSSSSSGSTSKPTCGGLLKARHGIIQTPNFPHKFPTPIECVWVIDASELPAISTTTTAGSSASSNISIVVYLSQLYVLGGLKFTEYMYYSDDYKVPAHRVFTLKEDDVTQVAWVQFNSQYLEIRFTMTSLDGTHLRALDRLLDVYGFNITYEVQHDVKPYQCNTLQCRFLGHCYAQADFSSYYCSCFPGFSGIDCGRGPLCEDPHTNICQNGGTCKHIGDAAITCHCPPGFKGTKCEIPEINEITMGCTANASASDCHRECDFERAFDGINVIKTSRNSARSGKTRYEVTIRLGANLTAYYRNSDPERRPSDHLPSLLERHLMRVLRNFNITKISDLELISNSTDHLDITFHFFGVKGDSNRIREAITRMVERGRIGNITLVSNYHLFDENPPLNLVDMSVNQKSAIRENSEFIISCTAQGSSRMQFQWFKDGAIVNASKAIREIWTTVLPPETKDVFTAILGVTKANRLDEGIYTCKVTDWGVEQCRSLHIHVKSPPRLRVDPASVTLHRGDSLRVRCLSPGNDDIKRYAQLGYSWTRNGVLFQSDPATVMWEDLYPDGSILKINNIQKSAEYACIVSNSVRPVAKSVYITVIDRSAVHVCRSETLYGVRWPTSAPGAAIVSDCPRGFEGHSRRICEKRDAGNSSWLLPDFSLCIRDQLLQIYNKFRALSSGFQQSNSSAILKSCFSYTIHRHKHFLPGEAGFLIDMLHEVDSYLQLKGTQLEREMAAEIILHILDKVMQNPQSLNSQQQIKKLQLLTQSAALNRETIAASQLATSTSTSSSSSSSSASSSSASAAAAVAAGNAPASSSTSAEAASSSSSSSSSSQADRAATSLSSSSTTSAAAAAAAATKGSSSKQLAAATLSKTDGSSILTVDEDSLSLDRLNSLRIYMTSVKMLPFNLRIYGDDLFSDQLYMDIGLSPRLLNIMANSTIFTSVISYKNLKSFLPKTYYTRGSDPNESDYILASRIIQTWLFQSNRSNDNFREPLDLSFEAGHVEIIFQHESAPKDSDWVAVCGHDYKASFESTWRSDLCITKNLMDNITRCICPLSGTYVVMLTKRNHNTALPHPPQRPLFVIISCACCLLQSCSAFIILLPIWYNRKCAIIFLKMQFCISTSSIMVIFLLGFLKMLPLNWQAIISSSLASLLLLGISTLIAIALVIHAELVPKKLLLHVSKAATEPTTTTVGMPIKEKQQQQQDMEKRHSSTSGNTNITQISGNNSGSNIGSSTLPIRRCSSRPTVAAASASELSFSSAAGRRGAIGISWLLPLLFAITAPLICSIIGKCPQHWWLEIMSSVSAGDADAVAAKGERDGRGFTDVSGGGNYFHTTHLSHPAPHLLNGDSILETHASSTTTTTRTTTTASAASSSATLSATAGGGLSTTTMSSSSSSSSSSTSWPHPHNNIFSASAASAGDLAAAPDADLAAGVDIDAAAASHPSLNFVLFVCVDLLFILLFFALFAILMKKLLWLWRKHPKGHHTHPLDKFNVAMGRRIGLLYRTGGLLLIKLCTDALFIAFVNSTHDSLWSYPFGISCMLLGFAILVCFVLKAECNLRDAHHASGGSGSSGGSSNSGSAAAAAAALKKKLSSSKTSLDENYCTGSINSPLSFYTNHEKEKENESGAPPPTQLDMSAVGVQLPLTIISTAPRCQMMAPQTLSMHHELPPLSASAAQQQHHSNVQSFLGSAAGKGPLPPHMQSMGVAGTTTLMMVASPATRCCNILSGGQSQALPPGSAVGYYDAYGGLTGSLSRRSNHQQQQQQQQMLTAHEFVGVESLDILQGVSPDSIIGIRTSSMLPTTTQYHHQQLQQQQQHIPQHHKPYVDAGIVNLPPSIVSISSLTTVPNYSNSNNSNSNNCSSNMSAVATTITTTSVTTQTPKAQKRVTIMEPTTHTFDPMLPTMVAVSAGQTTVAAAAATAAANTSTHLTMPTPIITITSSSIDEGSAVPENSAATATVAATEAGNSSPEDENSINGMFDRITHDLDFLLNRTNELPPPPLPPTGSIPAESSPKSSRRVADSAAGTATQHDVILEEPEPEL